MSGTFHQGEKEMTERTLPALLLATAILGASLAAREVRAQETETEQPVPTLYAYVEYMQVPEGGDELYLKVEGVWRKIHAVRKEAGLVTQWVVCKVNRTQGPPGDYNYAVVHVFDSWDKIENLYPMALLQDKFVFDDQEREIMSKTRESREMVRTELWKLQDAAVVNLMEQGDFDPTIQLGFLKSKDGQRHGVLEREFWKKIWTRAVEDGLRSNWLLWNCRFPGGTKRAFNQVAVHLFPKGEPEKKLDREWWEKALPETFPDKSQEEIGKLFRETGEVRDIPIVENWTIVMMASVEE